jgi:hypothetical protein
MRHIERAEPLPDAMQGRWIDINEPSSELMVTGGEIVCFGHSVEYDYKGIEEADGALTVTLKIRDAAQEESFQSTNITGLVITPEGELHAYNVRFASQFVRPQS